jgi:hypothetical protein
MYTRAYLAGDRPTYMYSTEVQDDHTGRLGKPFVSSNSGWAIQPEHGKALPETRMIAFSLLIFPHIYKEREEEEEKERRFTVHPQVWRDSGGNDSEALFHRRHALVRRVQETNLKGEKTMK